jgi:hypothetical protein
MYRALFYPFARTNSSATQALAPCFVHAKDKFMRDFRDAKTMAQTLRSALAAMGLKITVSQSLELIARAFGVSDWNTLSAAIRSEATAVPENTPQPPPAAEGTKTTGATLKLLSKQLESTLNRAFAYAKGRKHEEITVEHLLLFLLEDADALRVIKGCGIDPGGLQNRLNAYFDTELKTQAGEAGETPRPTLGFQRVLQRAVYHVQNAGRPPVTGMNVLVATFSEKASYAVKLLNEQGMTRLDAVNFITRGTMTGGGDSAGNPPPT